MSTASQAAELKQQGAIEAASDPNSSVQAIDAERKIAEESRKAGAFSATFDPDASPEEKAAQARARVPEGFHHEHKPKGIAVATDIDDGTPGAYNLPPPTTAGALAPTGPLRDKNGELLEKSNGHIAEDEEADWVEKVGWAPRFGNGQSGESEDGENMLDHQTWVEGKLDEKFFGDWYHNTGVIIFACLASWLVAVLGGGLGWVFIVMSICGTYYRTSIRRVRRNFRDDVNREMAKHRLETDTESLEWINSFMVKFWPIYAPVLAQTVISSVDQVLSTSTPAFLDSLRMKHFTLGTKPPRMDHVKTYPKAEDDIVLMDWKFSFTPNDVADLTSRQLKNKVNPKVVLEVRIGKAMISKGLDVIVEDFSFSGLMRVKVKLQIPFPHVEKVEISFLEKPEIDYVCKPLGGDTLGFDINFIPGLEGFILEMIHANIGPIFYAPNVFPIEIAKMLAGNPVDQAIGVIAVTLHGAQGLKNTDKFAGTPDPYVVVSLNHREELARTKTIKENANPKWNETKYIIVTNLNDSLTLQVFDFNEIRKDKELGVATFPLERIQEVAEHENETLEVSANGKPRGNISADIRFFPVLEGNVLEDGKKEPPPESNTGIARFTVEQAKDLDGTKSLMSPINPYAVLLLNNKEVHRSRTLKRTNNPIWDNGSKELLITDRKSAKLGVVIKDDRELSAFSNDTLLGTYQIKIDDMLSLMEKGQEWYNLAGVKSGRAKITMQWKPIALSGVGAGTGGYVTPIGVMRIHFKSARDLRNMETMGKSDPYGRVLLSGIEKGRTVTFQSNLNPDWDEVLYVPMHSTRERLVLEVMDQEKMGKDRSLGQLEIAAADYIEQAENGEYLVHDLKEERSGGLKMHGKGAAKGNLNYSVSFYPCLNVADPEDEEKTKKSIDGPRLSMASEGSGESKGLPGSVDPMLIQQLEDGAQEQEETTVEMKLPKIHLSPEELLKYESGLIIFKLMDAELSEPNCHIEVLVDDMAFPSYVSSKARSRRFNFDEIGDCVVRELEFSKITLRVREKADAKSDGDEHTIARLTGNTIDTLKQCLNNPTILKMKDEKGEVSSIKVSLKYIPIKMQLDPSESINNMGKLRVDVLDATDLPSADRNGYSDPYCKFELNGVQLYKTKVQKKTLHPAWNEFFEVDIPSRTAAQFKCTVYDWDFGDKADLLGATAINLDMLDPFKAQEFNLALDGKSGSVRIRMVFRPDYVTRSRQGSSTFSGTFAAPGKVITGVAGAPIKGVGFAAHGIGKGASFMRKGFSSKSKKTEDDTNGSAIIDQEDIPMASSNGGLRRATGLNGEENGVPPTTPPGTAGGPSTGGLSGGVSSSHSRTKSFGASSNYAASFSGGYAAQGTAEFTIVSATGYPPSASVMVFVKQLGSKGSKVLHKTKHIKSPNGPVVYNDTFSTNCSADSQFTISVKAHATFGSDDDLGEGMLVIDESGSGLEKSVKAGNGTVMVKSNFIPNEISDSPTHGRSGGRKSFLGTRGMTRSVSREVTPTPH